MLFDCPKCDLDGVLEHESSGTRFSGIGVNEYLRGRRLRRETRCLGTQDKGVTESTSPKLVNPLHADLKVDDGDRYVSIIPSSKSPVSCLRFPVSGLRFPFSFLRFPSNMKLFFDIFRNDVSIEKVDESLAIFGVGR